MKHGSLFSGIGGFDLASQWMGWENIFHCEIDEWCRKILHKNFPNSKQYADIKEFDGTKYRGAVDIISGGFPCQPFSTAGKRLGKTDDRYLWEEMLRVINEIKPTFIVGENVAGIISMEFGEILASLENLGYRTIPFLIPALSVNGIHKRNRVWIIAYSNSGDAQNKYSELGISQEEIQRWTSAHVDGHSHLPSWGRMQSEDRVYRINDGLPRRMDELKRLKGLGNAIVPQVAYEIFKCIGQLAVSPLNTKTNGA